MVSLKDFLEPGMRNDIIIQMSLREIDAEVLVNAFFAMDEAERGMILRNMSKRAVAMIQDDFDAKKNVSEAAARAARDFFISLLDKNSVAYVEPTPEMIAQMNAVPEVDCSSDQATIASFVAMSRFALRKGMLSLEPLREKVQDPFLRKGLALLAECQDPLLIKSIMENYKTSYLRAMETRLDLFISGIDSIAQQDGPHITEEKLKALIAEF
jgi:hypothetical protein